MITRFPVSLVILALLAACREPTPPEEPPTSITEQGEFSKAAGSGVLAALASGRYYAVPNPGHVTAQESAAVLASGNDERVVQLVTKYDFLPFTASSIFAAAPPPRGLFELGGWDSLANFGWESDHAWAIPPTLSDRRVVFNNAAASWGEHGPKWGIRSYNVVGKLADLELWRCGDWSNGREGHACYLNVAGDLELTRLRAVQCGGQALQIVWRVGETRMPRSSWPTAANLIALLDCSAQDCGAITDGQAVRASWPFSFFATGARVELKDLRVDTRLPEFVGDRGERFRAHGALLVTGGEEGRRTPNLVVDGLAGKVTRCDRSEVRLQSVDVAELRNLTLTEEGGDGACTVDVVDDCRSVHISGSSSTVVVRVISSAKPFSAPYWTATVAPGGEFKWP